MSAITATAYPCTCERHNRTPRARGRNQDRDGTDLPTFPSSRPRARRIGRGQDLRRTGARRRHADARGGPGARADRRERRRQV
ncbi:hypothetical protein C2U71_15815, partial [Burkholderia ubonensis]